MGKIQSKKPFISQIWDSKTSTIENLCFLKMLNLGLYLSRKVYVLERLSNYFEWRKVLFASRACEIGKIKTVSPRLLILGLSLSRHSCQDR